MSRVIVLNLDYSFLNTISLKKAIKYIIEKKVEVIESTNRLITNIDKKIIIKAPLVVKLLKYIRTMYKAKVPFTRKNIHLRDEKTCQYCGDKTDLTIDHIIPVSRGGKTNWENCVTSCRTCNNKKGNKTPYEVKMKLKKKPIQPTIMEFIISKTKMFGLDDIIKKIFN